MITAHSFLGLLQKIELEKMSKHICSLISSAGEKIRSY